ncbi:MAG: 2,3-bisphosphoglycerate-independent phosphoglycerate mutase [Patescibacteria group bacterium]|jgi:2,3-bisphosphoglycerate-independent phosphoglycerate mutase
MSPDQSGNVHRPRPVVLLVLDGFGIAPDSEGNAITRAQTPTFHMLTQRYPSMTLRASSEEVGLNWGEMGNSEVGHLAIGAGRVYYQTLPRLGKAITNGEFMKNEALVSAIDKVKSSGGTLHLMGILSSGKVHGFDEHCYALLRMAKEHGIKRVAVHAMLDGRDTLYNAGLDFIKNAIAHMKEIGIGQLATISGRYFAMDRDNRWDRIEKAYNAIALGRSDAVAEDPIAALELSYSREVYDEEFVPTVLQKDGKPVAVVTPGDAVIFWNYRPDRARELTKAFVMPVFESFHREPIRDVLFVTMTEYESGLPVSVAFTPEKVIHPLAEVLSDAGLVQLHVAETEKYAHVTFFFNGTREEPFLHEDRALIPSPHVSSYSEAPEMSAISIADKILEEIGSNNYDVIIANFANADMVGHTGDLEATIKGVETIDGCVGKIVEAVLAKDGVIFITADHGNAEEVLNLQTHDIDKEHSTNPVPFWIVGKQFEGKPSIAGDAPDGDLSLMPPCGILADIAPTMLAILGIPQPPEMTGTPLL